MIKDGVISDVSRFEFLNNPPTATLEDKRRRRKRKRGRRKHPDDEC